MPIIVLVDGGAATPSQPATETTLGVPVPPPPPPTAPATLGSSPTVSSRPTPNQGIATDSSGKLPTSVAAQSIPMLAADPANPVVGQMWFRTDTLAFSVKTSGGVKRATFA